MPTIRTTCPYCGVGCGVLVSREKDGRIAVTGDPAHPANLGRLCSKGAALGETLSLDDRLLHPEVGGQRASWDEALDLVARRFGETIAADGPDSVAFYVSGQILTEDYYVANKLMKGFIGAANIDTNSRLCMASSVAGHKRAFGSDTVPGCYEDLEQADLVMLVGSNLAWCHPVLYQRLAAAKEKRGTRVVVVDPRRTATCEIAYMHLAIQPGTDVALFNGLLTTIVGLGAVDRTWTAQHTSGLAAARDAAMAMPLATVARTTGLDRQTLFEFYDLLCATERTVTVYSQGVNQSTAGTDKVNAIINCHLATGRIGRPGMGPFSVTGQPNAMGGRETGGLANMLAAHMEITDPAHRRIVQDFWRAPRIAEKPGLKAVDLFRAVADGKVKSLWIMGTNPAVSMPEADAVRAAIAACQFVVVSDVTRQTDTARLAHVLLPSAAWGEKSGTVTNSERRISRQRPFLAAPGEARADWWQLAQVGRRMGWSGAFAWSGPADVFAEYAELTTIANAGRRDLDLGNLARLSAPEYDALEPVQWPRRRKRMFADGRFYTPDGRARFVPTPWRAPAASTGDLFPLRLLTGRIRDQWHTMTRTAKAARLMDHVGEPYLEIHPEDAGRLGIEGAGIVRVSSPHGSVLLRTVVTDRVIPGTVFAPMHWTGETASQGRIDVLVAANVDPVSGQPELKAMPVAVAPAGMAWHGFLVRRSEPADLATEYWAKARAEHGWRAEVAGMEDPADWAATARALLGISGNAEVVGLHDAATGTHRIAAFAGERLVGALWVSRGPVAVARGWAAAQLAATFAEPRARLAVLAGRPGAGERDKGPIVCACLEVGRNDIAACLGAGARTIAAVGTATGAGTNCGSCRPEIGRLIAAANNVARAAAPLVDAAE